MLSSYRGFELFHMDVLVGRHGEGVVGAGVGNREVFLALFQLIACLSHRLVIKGMRKPVVVKCVSDYLAAQHWAL